MGLIAPNEFEERSAAVHGPCKSLLVKLKQLSDSAQRRVRDPYFTCIKNVGNGVGLRVLEGRAVTTAVLGLRKTKSISGVLHHWQRYQGHRRLLEFAIPPRFARITSWDYAQPHRRTVGQINWARIIGSHSS